MPNPEQQAQKIREQAAACGLSPEEYVRRFSDLTPEQIKPTMWKRDAETICAWVEPKPNRGPYDFQPWWSRSPEGWWMANGLRWNSWHPRELDLDALHEVEKRLLQDNHFVAIQFGIKRYLSLLDAATGGMPWHASAEQKIEALACTIREVTNA